MTHPALSPVALADVALPVPLGKAFSYAIPHGLSDRVVPGVRALCPFGNRRLVGVVLGVRTASPPPRIRQLIEVVDETPAVPRELLAFAAEVARYYFAPIGDVLRLALPPLDRRTEAAMRELELFGKRSSAPSPRQVQWVSVVDSAEAPPALKGQAKELLSTLRATGACTLSSLLERWGNARAAVKRLSALGLVQVDLRAAPEAPAFATPEPRDVPPTLTVAQADAVTALEAALHSAGSRDAPRGGRTFLLHGVTGSGKTEVYLRVIAAARTAKRGTIVLVPEIALTPQLVARYRARFGDDVAVLHSGLTVGERLRMWRRIRDGEVLVVMGARSALFAPIPALGLVMVDEEHDPSFKQEEGVRYHARDMAILRAHLAGAVCVLGTATPSLETEWLTRSGKAERLVLPDRATAHVLPRVELVDLRRMGPGPTGDKRLSLPLHRAIDETLARGEQIILFLNRRGFAPSVRCTACGEMAACPDCSVALTYHKRGGALLQCHYCGFRSPVPGVCPKCEANALVLEGVGTERLEETLTVAFPRARVARLDRDVASGKSVESILDRMRKREIDVLVGTQMVTKGHDLPHVTLVGVINADAALSLPDFRASERSFQLLVQVAGRAGRGGLPGRVLVQTYNPEHPAIVHAKNHDVTSFLEHELRDRRELSYPPFSRVALVRADAIDEKAARTASETLARLAHETAARSAVRVDIIGPAPAPLARLRNRYRFQLMLRSVDRRALRAVVAQIGIARGALPRAVHCTIDVDPMQLL